MDKNTRQIFTGMQILSGNKWLTDHSVVVEGGYIKAIISANMIEHHLPATKHEYFRDHYLIPGLIDLHVHGANGKDVMDGKIDSLLTISDALLREGVTGFLATTMTASADAIENAVACVSEFMQTPAGVSLLGAHLEGPFISRDKLGAQNAEHVQLPDIELFKKWQKTADNHIKLVTLAPELPGALDFVRALQDQQVVVSVGHTNATYEETLEAISAGCTQATHLFNAMSQMTQRAPGAVGALLLSRDVNAEIIVDGVHLHPAIVRLAYQVKGKEGLLLVSDAMRAKCMGDGCYDLGGQDVHVKEGKATLVDGTIAGSTLHLPDAIINMVKFSNCQLGEAIQMATFNPAQVLGLTQKKGSIDVGKDADLVVMDAGFAVKQTVRMGETVYKV
jgi:N-acetylglucosamine-6-phosphate deacetylase